MLSYNSQRAPFTNGHQNTVALDASPERISNGIQIDLRKHDYPKANHRHIWLITGPAGCGKTTVAEYIAESLKLPFLEGDNYHTKSNIDKMSHGIPLTDQDRWGWLIYLRDAAMQRLNSGSHGVIVTCSALKKRYRDVIRIAHYNSPDVLVHFIYLHAPEEVLLQRVRARKGHYMGANMVHSQLESLEKPSPEETDILSIDVRGTMAAVEAEALAMVREVIKSEPDTQNTNI